MPKVTFECTCPAAVVGITVQRTSNPADVEGLTFKESGSKTIELTSGTHEMTYRAVGARRSHIGLTVTKGGKLDRDVDRDLGTAGRAGGSREVIVAGLILLLMTFDAAPAFAQAPDKTAENVRATKQALLTLPAAGMPRVPSLSFNFEATTKEKTGAVSINAGKGDAFNASLTVSGPLDDSTKTGELVTKSGLTSGASAELGFHWFIWRMPTTIAGVRAMCQQYAKKASCDDNEISDPAARRRFLRATGATADPIVIDITASTGRNNFKFLDATTFAPGKEQHRDKGFAMAIGKFTPTLGLVSVGYGFEKSWKPAGPARNICSPISGSTSTECRTAPVGPPSSEDEHLLRVEQRVFFGSGHAAAAPVVAYDVKNKVTSVTVPLYFFALKDGGLAGGIKGSWNSKDHDASVAVFVGPAFKLFK